MPVVREEVAESLAECFDQWMKSIGSAFGCGNFYFEGCAFAASIRDGCEHAAMKISNDGVANG